MFNVPHLAGKEALILALLMSPRREMYGLELVKASGERLARGTVYVTLGRMEEKGYVTSYREQSPPEKGAIPRRLYCLTPFGARVFAAWEVAESSLIGATG